MIRARVYRIDLAMERADMEWEGAPWAFDVIDAEAPTRRLDGAPELIDWGYSDDHAEALRDAVERVAMMREIADGDRLAQR